MKIKFSKILPVLLLIFFNELLFFHTQAQSDTSYYVYVSLRGDNSIVVYKMDHQSGNLEKIYTRTISGGPASLALDPSKQHLYVAQRSSNSISGYTIDRNTGKLNLINSIVAVDNPVYISTDRSGEFLLSAYFNANKAAVYTITADGMLDDTPDKTFTTGTNPHAILTDLSNRFLYISNMTGNKIQQFSFDSTNGNFTSLDPSEVIPPENTGPRHFVFHPTKQIVYFVNETGNSVTVYHINDTSGCLTELQIISTLPPDFSSTNKSADIHLTSDHLFLYASNRGHESIAAFRVDPESGLLSSIDQYPTVTSPRAFDIDPSGTFLYAAGETSNNLACYRINKITGVLDSLYTIDVGQIPSWVLVVQFITNELSGWNERYNQLTTNSIVDVFPNPFNLTCKIRYHTIQPSGYKIKVVDVTGRVIKDFGEYFLLSGNHELEWDGKDNSGNLVANGIYFCLLNSSNGNEIVKLMLER